LPFRRLHGMSLMCETKNYCTPHLIVDGVYIIWQNIIRVLVHNTKINDKVIDIQNTLFFSYKNGHKNDILVWVPSLEATFHCLHVSLCEPYLDLASLFRQANMFWEAEKTKKKYGIWESQKMYIMLCNKLLRENIQNNDWH
jgi:hypothetical protein